MKNQKIICGILLVAFVSITSLFGLCMQTSKREMYVPNQKVEIVFQINETGYIFYDSFSVYRFENGKWKKNIYCPQFGCIKTCINGKLNEICIDPGFVCKKIVNNTVRFTWDLRECKYVKKWCGFSGKYTHVEYFPAKKGKYKIELCYYKNEKCTGKRICIEKIFHVE